MDDKKWISASDVGLFVFCPRAWALKQLEYEPDNQWEIDAGNEFHRTAGRKELERHSAIQKKRIRNRRFIHLLVILTVIVLLCLISLALRITIK